MQYIRQRNNQNTLYSLQRQEIGFHDVLKFKIFFWTNDKIIFFLKGYFKLFLRNFYWNLLDRGEYFLGGGNKLFKKI